MIHAIPHTHLDAGWIENIEAYYSNYVVEIFRTLIPELEANPHYRFNWAEVGFLQRWWSSAEKGQKERFKKLVDNGQIQFVGGYWVQSDEANVEYWNQMDNIKLGF
jgi:hypothetical protein